MKLETTFVRAIRCHFHLAGGMEILLVRRTVIGVPDSGIRDLISSTTFPSFYTLLTKSQDQRRTKLLRPHIMSWTASSLSRLREPAVFLGSHRHLWTICE